MMQSTDTGESTPQAGETVAARRPAEDRGPSAFIPVLILTASLAVWTGFQTYQFLKERDGLSVLRANQEVPLQQAQKVRQTLDQLATETQKLAEGGNPNARLVVDELRKRGVTINRPAQPPAEKK
jgi:hypothetical protein